MTTARQTPDWAAESRCPFALAVRQQRAGRLEEAAAAYRQLLALRPNCPSCTTTWGGSLPAGAIRRSPAAVRASHRPEAGLRHAYNNLATAADQGRLDLAAAAYRRWPLSHTQRPTTPWPTCCASWAEPDEAGLHYRQVWPSGLASPRDTATWAIVLAEQQRFDEAADHYRAGLLALKPDHTQALNSLGNVRRREGSTRRWPVPARAGSRPDYPTRTATWEISGEQGKLDAARGARIEQVSRCVPIPPTAHYKLGRRSAWTRANSTEASADSNGAGNPARLPHAQLGLAICYLSQGDYQRGWPAFKTRLRHSRAGPHRPAALDRARPGRPQPAGGGRARLGRYAAFHALCPAAQGAGRRVGLAVQAALGRLLGPIRTWTSCSCSVRPSCPAAIFIFRC